MEDHTSLHPSFQKQKQAENSGFAESGNSFSSEKDAPKSNQISVPQIALPKGGGAIKSIDEKFAMNAVSGTSSLAIPLPVAPARQGFVPALELSYNSGSGNDFFGLGWSVSIPAISRRTDKELPQYLDDVDSDVYLYSGAEDLVPWLEQNENQEWEEKKYTQPGNEGYHVKRYRPRIEGSFARIERWTKKTDGDIFWKVTTRDNVVSVFGRDVNARIADPMDQKRIFKWLLDFSYDDKGNCIQYQYKKENNINLASTLNEQHRLKDDAAFGNIYPEKIFYGAKTPYDPVTGVVPEFMFSTVFDYCEIKAGDPPDRIDNEQWTLRKDPFSDFHSCFERRMYRLCHRVLQFHHFEELGNDPYLVKSLDITYQHDEEAGLSLLSSLTFKGYAKKSNGSYEVRQLPPMTFQYQDAGWDTTLKYISPDELVHAPVGIDDQDYAWVDLYSEGVSGILSEQANAWWYKSNLGDGQFAAAELVAETPSITGLNKKVFIQELEADGRKFLVTEQSGLPGFFEMNEDGKWLAFQEFTHVPNINFHDAKVKFIDLNGDGKADMMISEDDVFCWYESEGKKGFNNYTELQREWNEDKGPVVTYNDPTQLVMLADMNGDGLTDIVRIRNGEIVYWPNMGFGKFGAKTIMEHAPMPDRMETWNPQYVRLTDLNGSGTPDLVYLGRDSFLVWFNQNGNAWSDVKEIRDFPEVSSAAHITTVDLLANGTSCIVWSSPLPADSNRQLRYIDLMKGKKPFVLTGYENNLGKRVDIDYRSSSHFYLDDKKNGRPWITKLPFPVQCVERVVVTDKWRKTRFASTYTYHHGYFDYTEREFRGFGRVEQVDVESFGAFASGNVDSPYITQDKTLYQPPVKTITWVHTGCMHQRRLLKQFEEEYFPNSLPAHLSIDQVFHEKPLQEPDLGNEALDAMEWREALRACKGMTLRQEIYELDVDALETGMHKPVRLFSAAVHNCNIRKLQPRDKNMHGVFQVQEQELLTYQYELAFPKDAVASILKPDPRITHNLQLSYDKYGNVQQSVAMGYPRLRLHEDATLEAGQLGIVQQLQQERHLGYSETLFTNDVILEYDAQDPDRMLHYRLRNPYEVSTYELHGITPASGFYFEPEEFLTLKLSAHYLPVLTSTATDLEVHGLAYHLQPPDGKKYKRLVENARTLFFNNNCITPLALGVLESLGMQYEQYKLAITDDLLQAIFDNGQLTEVLPDGSLTGDALHNASISGYLSGNDAVTKFGNSASGQYWIRSGIAGFNTDAAAHFYLPERYTDPFGSSTVLKYDDKYDLFIKSSTNPLGQVTQIEQFDYRVLMPAQTIDINENKSRVCFDALGLPVAVALMGKGTEGDNLDNFNDARSNPVPTHVNSIFSVSIPDETTVRDLLDNATMRHLYHYGEKRNNNGEVISWCDHPAGAFVVMREKHVVALTGNEQSKLQMAFEFSDGMGTVLVKKNCAEPENGSQDIRWVVNGKTILNNKGKAVKQYEPYFAPSGGLVTEQAEIGVTPVMYYDAAGRLIRTELPDGSILRVTFSPWFVQNFDANDTVLDAGNKWYSERTKLTAPAEEQRAAQLAAAHANTPSTLIVDSLGREVLVMAHNRVSQSGGNLKDEKYMTILKMDAEGKPLWTIDARGNLAMQYVKRITPSLSINTEVPQAYVPAYDISGNLLFQHSMDSGDRYTINDAAGQSLFSWDGNGNLLMKSYDAVHRPVRTDLKIAGQQNWILAGLMQYESNGGLADTVHNLAGQVYQTFDQSGCIRNVRFDFKGNLLETSRCLGKAYTTDIDWSDVLTKPETNWRPLLLMAETFVQISEFDALNRQSRSYNWHRPGYPVAVYEPKYNERGLLIQEELIIKANKTANGYTDGNRMQPIRNISYDAKGQRLSILYGNDVKTNYTYDPNTFRVVSVTSLRSNNLLQQLNYTYDAAGNITEQEDRAIPTVFFNQFIIQPRNRYSYDALYRLVEAEGREHAGQVQQATMDNWHDCPFRKNYNANDTMAWRNYVQRYEYDSAGNILVMRHTAQGNTAESWTRQYQYAVDSNRLLASGYGAAPASRYTDQPTLSYTYAYNIQGSITQLPHLPVMDWDFTEHLKHISRAPSSQGTDPDGCVDSSMEAWYCYGSDMNRSRKRVEKQNNITEERLYFNGLEWYRRFENGLLVEEIETIHFSDGSQKVMSIDDVLQTNRTDLGVRTLLKYILSNHLGSSMIETDETAQIISYEEYHPYGTTAYQAGRNAAEVKLKRYRYTGMERDEESGLSYHGARYYIIWIARWASTDPAGFVDGLNLYQYVHSNPVGHIDTTGTEGQSSSWITTERFPSVRLLNDEPASSDTAEASAPAPAAEITYDSKDNQIKEAARTFRNDPFSWEGFKALMFGGAWYISGTATTPEGKPLSSSEKFTAASRIEARKMGFGKETSRWLAGYDLINADAVQSEWKENTIAALPLYGRLRQGVNLWKLTSLESASFREWNVSHELAKKTFNDALVGPASEIPGLKAGIEMMAWNNWKLSATQFKRGGNQGLDLFFEGAGENTGLTAFLESKGKAGLGQLNYLESAESIGLKIRQGGKYYIGFNLETYIVQGGSNSAKAKDLLVDLNLGNVKSFASSSSGKLWELKFDMWADFTKEKSAFKLIYKK